MDRVRIMLLACLLILGLVYCGGQTNSSLETSGIETMGGTASTVSTVVPVPRIDLLTAINQSDLALVKRHMEAGTDPNINPIPDPLPLAGAFPLHLAIVKGDIDVVRTLIDYGARLDIKAANQDGATPLHWASFFLQESMVRLLVESGAPINFVDDNGATPVDTAVFVWLVSPDNLENREKAEKIKRILVANGGKPALAL